MVADGVAEVHLRLPTYFCAPNFAFLMVADAHDAVSAVPGVRQARVVLDDHFAATEINGGVAARAGFAAAFAGLAAGELDELRVDFLRKAVLAGTDRVCRPLLAAGRPAAELAGLRLGSLPPSPELDRLRARRAELGLPAGDDAPLLVDPATGAAGRRGRAAAAPAPGPADPDQPGGQRRGLPGDAAGALPGHRHRGGGPMKAVRLHGYHQQPVVEEVPEPVVKGPFDVLVRVGGAGVCRTDLHIVEGQWADAMAPELPYTLGHENAGWVHEVGSAVTNVAVGDTVILHPTPTCGLCRACRGRRRHALREQQFPGLSHDGGMAEYLLTSARACVKLDPRDPPGGRGRAGRRRHHRLPRGGARRCRCCGRAPPARSSAPAGSATSASSALPR